MKLQRQTAILLSFLVSLSSGEKFSGPSCWKHSGFSLVSHIPHPTPSYCHCLSTVSPLRVASLRNPERQPSFGDTGQFLCTADYQRIKEVASIITKE